MPGAAVADVLKMDALSAGRPFVLSFYRPLGAPADRFGFKVYQAGTPVVLSESLPMLEHMGVRVLSETRNRIGPDGAGQVWIHDFALQAQVADDAEMETLARLFEDAFAAVFSGRIENDDFNRLVLRAGIAADDVVVLRAYAKYFRQIGFALSQSFIEGTLTAHPRIARMLVQLFKLRFDPRMATTLRPPARATRSSRRSRRSATCPRTACCASIWARCARRCARISGARASATAAHRANAGLS